MTCTLTKSQKAGLALVADTGRLLKDHNKAFGVPNSTMRSLFKLGLIQDCDIGRNDVGWELTEQGREALADE